jgi:Flp pilus assembly pilin Flp
MDQIIKFFCDESGASAVEYAFLLAFIAVAIAASVTTFANALQGLFQRAATQLPPAG